MKINPLWYLCITVRLLLIVSIVFIYTKSKNKKIIKITGSLILLLIGLGFLVKGITGSNNEIQIAKVFWHETRFVHACLYILASIYLYIGDIKISSLLLTVDVIFSVLYRLISNT